jgi:predicted small lipoprotein YifL
MVGRQPVAAGLRWVALLMVVAALAAPLSACGKKGKLTPPDGAQYPKDYPTR